MFGNYNRQFVCSTTSIPSSPGALPLWQAPTQNSSLVNYYSSSIISWNSSSLPHLGKIQNIVNFSRCYRYFTFRMFLLLLLFTLVFSLSWKILPAIYQRPIKKFSFTINIILIYIKSLNFLKEVRNIRTTWVGSPSKIISPPNPQL